MDIHYYHRLIQNLDLVVKARTMARKVLVGFVVELRIMLVGIKMKGYRFQSHQIENLVGKNIQLGRPDETPLLPG